MACLYDKNSQMINNSKINSESCKTKDLWITDFVLLQNVNKVALGFTTKEIGIYEMTTKLDFNCQYRITHLKSIPLCIDYWYDPSNPNDAIILWGDTVGEVHIIFFNSATIALFERPTANTNNNKSQSGSGIYTCVHILNNFKKIVKKNQISFVVDNNSLEVNINDIKENFKNATYLHYKAHHKAWVRQGKFNIFL